MEVEQQPVAFYAWVEGMPSEESIHISGGERVSDANGMIKATHNKEAHFSKGLCRTDDPETIAVLRAMIKRGATYTEDHEVYLSHILTDAQKVARNQTISQRMVNENNALRQKLEEESRKNKEIEARLSELEHKRAKA